MKALAAHKRLMESLPVRTHKMRHDDPEQRFYSPRVTKWQSKAMRAQVLAENMKGLAPKEIAEKLGMKLAAVYNYLRVR